nr:3-oxoacyl-ACP synthase [uncultured Winogradskyella sp.]
MTLKQQLYSKCKAFIDHRLLTIKNNIRDIEQGLLSETKSSAGDKHETGRAMLQLEREKTGQQLANIQNQFGLLSRINPETTTNTVALGSLVFTTQFNYFIAISAGKIEVGEQSFFAISAATPIGKLLLSKTKGDSFKFRQQDIMILKIM